MMIAYGINLSFTKTTNINSADIIVKMGPTGDPYGSPYSRVTHTLLNSTTYLTSTITLNDYVIYSHWSGGVLAPGQILDIVMHEIGHTIGLADITDDVARTNNITSVMVYNINSPYFSWKPTSFDATNIRKLY